MDLRRVGSGNIGATNVLRAVGKGAAALTLLGDIGKGALAVGLARWAGASARASWRRWPWPRSSATSSRCGSVSRRQGRGHDARGGPGGDAGRRRSAARDLGGRRGDLAVLVAGGVGGDGDDARCSSGCWTAGRRCSALSGGTPGADRRAAPGEHPDGCWRERKGRSGRRPARRLRGR